MHRTVGIVFKILMLSILLMILLDTAMILVQVFTVHTRIENIAGLIQTEVARNNCLPNDIADSFLTYLNDIAGRNRLMDNQFQVNAGGELGSNTGDIKTNFKRNLGSYEALTPSNAKNYGEITTVAIEVTLHPLYVIMGTTANSIGRRDAMNINLEYVYKVPCLRYLK